MQAVLFPNLLVKNREDFELGMDLSLQVLSLGMMPKQRRQRITAARVRIRALCGSLV
jgi:hypothetical protein